MQESSSNQPKEETIVISQLSTYSKEPAFSSRPSLVWQLSAKKANTSSSSSMTKPAASNPSSSLENSTLSTRISDHSPAEDSVPRCAVIVSDTHHDILKYYIMVMPLFLDNLSYY